MTQEEKELLLKDLCARLPYGIKFLWEDKIFTLLGIVGYTVYTKETHQYFLLEDCKQYLRTMSSMTEEEAMEVAKIYRLKDILSVGVKENCIFVELDAGVFGSEIYTILFNEIVTSIELLDWLNSHHFDYRGLIEKGLALEAKEGMYN